MKKFFAILLLAIIACQVVGETIKFKNLYSGDSELFNYIVEDAIKWLKRNKHLDEIKDFLNQGDKASAIEVCTKYFKENICLAVVEKDLNNY